MVKEDGEKGIAVSLLSVEWRGGFERASSSVSICVCRDEPNDRTL